MVVENDMDADTLSYACYYARLDIVVRSGLPLANIHGILLEIESETIMPELKLPYIHV